MNSQVRSELTEFILANYLFGDEARLPRDDESLIESGVVDSTGILELIEFLESSFGVTVTDEETVPQNLGSIANVVAFVTAKQALAPGAA